ncbi:hypothetical protein RUND412_001029 [Rhizina undulata]
MSHEQRTKSDRNNRLGREYPAGQGKGLSERIRPSEHGIGGGGLEDRMDYPPRRSYHQYNKNNQSDSRSRVLDHRVNHHHEHTFYEDSSGRNFEDRLNMENMYDEKPARNLEERVNTETRPLEERISGLAPPPRKKEYNEDGDVNVNKRYTNGDRKNPVSSQDDFVPLADSMVTMSDESTQQIDASNAPPSNKSGGSLVAQSAGTITAITEKEIINDGNNPTNAKESSTTNVTSKDPEALRKKVLDSLAEKKKKAAVFMNQEKEGAKKESFLEKKGISGGPNPIDTDPGNLEKGPKVVSSSISNPEREAAVNALLAEAMGSAKSSKPEKGQADAKSGSSKHNPKASAEELTEQNRRKKIYPDDQAASDTGKPTQNDYQKIISPTGLEHHDPDSSRRSSFASHHISTTRNDKQSRPKKSPDSGPKREESGSYKDGQSQSSRLRMSPLSATRPEFPRGGHRGAFEYDDRDRREDPRREVRHPLERYEEPRDSRQLMGPMSPTLRADRRSIADKRLYSEEDKLRRRDELYRPPYLGKEEDPRDPYAPPVRHPRRIIEPELEYGSTTSHNFPSYIPPPPGRYLPPREDPRLPPLARPPEADYATLYYSDLSEWLEITGYHDYSYRQMSLRRHRELRALEGNRRLPIDEADQDAARGYIAQKIAPREELDAVSRDGRRARGSSVYAMPPPPAISSRDDRDTSGRVIPEGIPLRGPSRAGFYPPTSRPEDRPRYAGEFRGASPPIETSGQKRRISHRGDDHEDSLRPAVKSARITYEGSHRASISHSDEYVDLESAGAHPNHRSGHPDPTDNRQIPRRLQEDERFEDVDDETSSVRQTLSKRLAANRGRELSPVPSLRKRSMSPSMRHGLEHESRKDNFKRERDFATPSSSKFRREDDQMSSAGRQQRKLFEKGRRTPDVSPRQEKDHHKQGRPVSGKTGMKDDSRKPFPTRRGSADDYRSQNSLNNRLSFDDPKRKPGFGRGRGRGYSKEFSREKRLSYGEPMGIGRRLEGSNDLLDTRNADTRYFVVKSFNHDNVKMAQQDELWATQKKNSEIFEDAFKTSRDVILVFSVNKSGKFQGYARMESAPGTAPVPSWAKNLLWESSGPFRIRWITICDVNFHRVAHLSNRLNENQPVLIGRDGQEIDPECGAALCKLIDDSAAFRRHHDGDGI